MNDSNLSIYEGVADGLDRAATNLVNISMARQEHTKKMQLFDLQKKKGELDLKEMELVGADPEVLNAKKSIFTLNAKQAQLGLEKDTLLLTEAQKKAQKEMEDRQKEMQLAAQFEGGTLPKNIQYERKVGDTTISNKKSSMLEDIGGGLGAEVPLASPEERETFLQGFPQEIQNTIKGITDYSLNLKDIASLRGDQRLQLAKIAKTYDPTFDMTQFPTRAAFRKEFSSGKMGGNIRSFNTAIEHLSELDSAVEGVPSNPVKALTAMQRTAAEQLAGKSKTAIAMKKEQTALTAVAGELATIFKNTGGTDQEIQKWFDAYDPNDSAEAKREFIRTGVKLMQGRLGAIETDFERVMGKKNDRPILSEKNKGTVEKFLKENNSNEDFSKLWS